MKGDLQKMPLSFGTQQKDSTLYFSDFKAIEGQGYFLLFVLDALDLVDARIDIKAKNMNIACNLKLGKGKYELPIYIRL